MWYDKLLFRGRDARLKEKLDYKATTKSHMKHYGSGPLGLCTVDDIREEEIKPVDPTYTGGYVTFTTGAYSGVWYSSKSYETLVPKYDPYIAFKERRPSLSDYSQLEAYYRRLNENVLIEFAFNEDKFVTKCTVCGNTEGFFISFYTAVDSAVEAWILQHKHCKPIEEEFCTKCFRIKEDGKCGCNAETEK